MPPPVNILAIESSCDETSASVCQDGRILSNVVASQSIHEQYGGVVPELASRAHMQNIIPVVDAALKEAGMTPRDLSAIAYTRAPGLIGALLVGSGFARSMALALDIPLMTVHHMQAHVLANLIPDDRPSFPFLCLTVSGGHTQIVRCDGPLKMSVLGETIDDAAGEAFDKSAKLLGLPYPGGPWVDRHASKGDPKRFLFPEPQVPGLDFSFSGVKTSILYFLQEETKKEPEFVQKNLDDICAGIQHSIVSILLRKLKRASLETGISEICLAGGVAANNGLREGLLEMAGKMNWKTHMPEFQYCTDNAAMIAITGYHKFLAGDFAVLSESASARGAW